LLRLALVAPTAVFLLIVEVGCASDPPATATRPVAEPRVGAAEPARETPSRGRLTIAPLKIAPVGSRTPMLTLEADGRVSLVDEPLGTLHADGRLVFVADEQVVATVGEDGRVEITGPQNARQRLPGTLAGDLRAFEGRMRSAFVIDERGDARGAGGVLQLLPGGETSDGRLVVIGMTPSTRRTAMYLIVLATMFLN
jgi:hypothetical protein